MRKIFSILLTCFLFYSVNGKQLNYTQHYYTSNTFIINPAFAGSEFANEVTIGASKQWLGIKDSPTSGIITGSMRSGTLGFYNKRQFINKSKIKFKNRTGIGGMYFFDKNGPIYEMTGLLSYAYHLPLDNGKLSFGLSGMYIRTAYDISNSTPNQGGDSNLSGSIESKHSFDVNTGVLYYTKSWYIGLAVQELMQNSYYLKDYEKKGIDMYLSGGYRFEIMKLFEIKPSVIIKKTDDKDIKFDAHTYFSYDKDISFCLSLYEEQYIGYSISFALTEFLQIGYSFLQTVSDFTGNSAGTHMINLHFNRKK